MMNRYEDKNFKDSMRIKYDFNNLMDTVINEQVKDKSDKKKTGAISRADIDSVITSYSIHYTKLYE